MNKRMALNGCALLGLLASTTVPAEIQPGFYVGAGIGRASMEIGDSGSDADDTGFKVFGGYNFNQYVSIEATYLDGGEPDRTFTRSGNCVLTGCDSTRALAVDGFSVSALGRLPLGDMFSLFAKLGYASYDVDSTLRIENRFSGDEIFAFTNSDEDLIYGIGGAFSFGAFELRAEYEILDISDTDFNFLSISGAYRF